MILITRNHHNGSTVTVQSQRITCNLAVLAYAYCLDHLERSIIRNQLVEIEQDTVLPQEAVSVVFCVTHVAIRIPYDLLCRVDVHGLRAEVTWNNAKLDDFTLCPEDCMKVGATGKGGCARNVACIIDCL